MNETLFEQVARMMRERANFYFYDEHGNKNVQAGMVYDTCAMLMQYALEGDVETLRQYDYF